MRPGPAPDNRAMSAPASTLDPAIDAAPNQPRSKTDLFMSFTWLALQGFGGVLAVVQRELVEKKRWMTREQFVEDWAVAQIMPGPNVVNLSMMIGGRYFGLPGALAHLARWSSGHTDAIITEDAAAAEAFIANVDSAIVGCEFCLVWVTRCGTQRSMVDVA